MCCVLSRYDGLFLSLRLVSLAIHRGQYRRQDLHWLLYGILQADLLGGFRPLGSRILSSSLLASLVRASGLESRGLGRFLWSW